MGDARFNGLYMILPPIAITMLFVFILQLLLRLWMVNAPSYVRKHVRFPLNEDLTDYIMQKQEKPVVKSYTIPHGYQGQIPNPQSQGYSNYGYQGKPGYQEEPYQGRKGYQNQAYLKQ